VAFITERVPRKVIEGFQGAPVQRRSVLLTSRDGSCEPFGDGCRGVCNNWGGLRGGRPLTAQQPIRHRRRGPVRTRGPVCLMSPVSYIPVPTVSKLQSVPRIDIER
jgi:hypothetical protein